MKKYNLIIIGGGPAGLMSCVGAIQAGVKDILVIDKGERLGRKLIISGGGRCNVTNNKDIDEMIKNIPGNGRFMYGAFHQFGPQEIIRFFEGLGVALKEEDNGRMFPVTDKAITVANTLINYIEDHGVEIRLSTRVKEIVYKEGSVSGVMLESGETVGCKSLLVAVGGKSVPKTGSTGDGYPWLAAAGHTITDLYPTEVPVVSDESWIQERLLQGLSLREVVLTLYNSKGKRLTTQQGDIIFTHFGVSGPGALRLGHYVSVAIKKSQQPLLLTIDIMPDKVEGQIGADIWERASLESKKALKNILKGYLPERIIPLLLDMADINEETTGAHLSKQNLQKLSQLVKRFPLRITGTLPLEEAFVTGGGVSIKEIDPKTMGSKLVRGLFFAGEIMDVHAHTGGYNITIAFSSGYVAGRSVAEYLNSTSLYNN